MSDTSEPARVTSADLLAELRDEQKSFRFLMRVLAIIVVVALVIVGTTVVYFFMQLSSNMEELRVYNKYKDSISRAAVARQRETNQDEVISLREEIQAWQRYSDLSDFVRQKKPEMRLTPDHVDDAILAARLNFTEEELNEVTASLLGVVLLADDIGRIDLDRDDRLTMEIALEASRNDNHAEVIEKVQTLRKDVRSARFSGFADAALTELYYKLANQNTMQWDKGCDMVVQHADLAVAAGLRYPQLLLRKGDCLRKHGDVEPAYLAFDEAAAWLNQRSAENNGVEPLYLSRLVHHGVGTTLLAMAASEQLPENVDLDAALEKAGAELTIAAQKRIERGATQVGEAYTRENLGFIYIIRGEWQTALDHTADVDNVIPLAWNLTVRHIAAKKQREELESEGGSRGAIAELKEIERDTKGVLDLMECSRIYASELPKLLPAEYAPTIEYLTGRCTAPPAKGEP